MTRTKTNICIVFGGKSGEHEVSLQSAKSVYEAIDKQKYNVILAGIDKQGKWLMGNASGYLLNAGNPKLIALNKASATEVTPTHSKGSAVLMPLQDDATPTTIDVFFPLIHGTTGEDGSLQGMFELLDAAYVGSGVMGSAAGMDKEIMKRLFRDAGLPIARFRVLRKKAYTDEDIDSIANELKYPLFVKPANMGSSVGVSKAHNREELVQAIEEAFQYDMKVLCEEYVEAREIECAVLGNDDPIASIAGEVIPHHEFYSYEAKYIDEKGARLEIPAKIDGAILKKVQELAVAAFKTLDCSGMARVDFFLKADGTVLLNEINTIPGFTKISMYPKLWEASGISYKDLIDRLIALAVEKRGEKNKLRRTYSLDS